MLHPFLNNLGVYDPTAQPQCPIDYLGRHADARVNGLGNFPHHLKTDDRRPNFSGAHYIHQIDAQDCLNQPEVLKDGSIIAVWWDHLKVLLAVNDLQNTVKRGVYFGLKVEKGKEHPKVALEVKAAAEDLFQILYTDAEQDRVGFWI